MNRPQTRYMVYLIPALLLASLGMAEEKSPPPDVPFKLTVVLNEYDGSKKLNSLPYVMACKASHNRDRSSLRMGFRVPYRTGEGNSYSYQDVGTNLDCESALPDERGAFMIGLGVEHNAIYRAGPNDELRPGSPAILNAYPVTGGIHATLRDLLMHDGQTVTALTATDPVSGHVWKVEATLNVVK